MTLMGHVVQKTFSDLGYMPKMNEFLHNVDMVWRVIWKIAALHNQNTNFVEKNRLYNQIQHNSSRHWNQNWTLLTKILQFFSFVWHHLYKAPHNNSQQFKSTWEPLQRSPLHSYFKAFMSVDMKMLLIIFSHCIPVSYSTENPRAPNFNSERGLTLLKCMRIYEQTKFGALYRTSRMCWISQSRTHQLRFVVNIGSYMAQKFPAPLFTLYSWLVQWLRYSIGLPF